MSDLGGVRNSAELSRRLAVTAVALIVYRLGMHIPLPGIHPAAFARIGGGAAMERISILALGVAPLVTVLILVELVKVLVPACRRWECADERNRDKLNGIVLALALLAAAAQASGLAVALEGVNGLVDAPGTAFRLLTVATLVAGTAIAIWLADQVTQRGLGSGVWLLFLAPLLADLPHRIAALAALQSDASLLAEGLLLACAFAALVFAAVAGLVRADGGSLGTAATCLWSVLLAGAAWPWLMLSVALLAGGGSLAQASVWIGPTKPLALLLLAGLVVLFAYLYARSQRVAGATPAPVPTVLVAGTLAAITLASIGLPILLARLLPGTGHLIVLAVVALVILGSWWKPPFTEGAESKTVD